MMKSLYNTLVLALLCATACTKSIPTNRELDLDAISPFVEYAITPRAGAATILTVGTDTVAIASEPITVSVPRAALRSGALTESWSANEIYNNVSSAQNWQYLFFEDTPDADYDYNDLVLHVRFSAYKKFGKEEWNNTLSIQPVALGSTIPIKVGVLYKDLLTDEIHEEILIQNARAELFGGDPTFPINADPEQPVRKVTDLLTPYFNLTTGYELRVVWFVEVQQGRRHYAATSQYTDLDLSMITAERLPYGISTTWKMDYPIESCHIIEAYPGFREWVSTGNEATLLAGKKRTKLFPSMVNKLWDYTLN